MKNQILFLVFILFSGVVYSQEELSDEFEILEPAVEINSSQENIKPEEPNIVEIPEENPIDLSNTPSEIENDDDTVMVQTREEPAVPQENSRNELVELRTPRDVFLPYKQRQSDWGFLFSVGAEQAKFPGLITLFATDETDNFSFEEMFGKNGVTMLSIEMGPKYNTRVGSFALLGGYGSLNKKDSRLGAETEIDLTRYELSIVYYLDTIFEEPYFIPYIGAGAWQADYRETTEDYPGEVEKFSSDPGTQYRVGALFGLDWIEGDAARVSRKKNGTQGTFLNLYAISTIMSESNPYLDLENDFDLGASLVIEF